MGVRVTLIQPKRDASAPPHLLAIPPAAQFTERFVSQADAMARAVACIGRPLNELRTLPLISRRTAWAVLIDAQSAQPVGLVALDSFEGKIGR